MIEKLISDSILTRFCTTGMALTLSAASLSAQLPAKAIQAQKTQSAALISARQGTPPAASAIPPGAIPAMRMGPSGVTAKPHPDGIDVHGHIEIQTPKDTLIQTTLPFTFDGWLIEQVETPRPPLPANWASLPREAKINWNRDFFSTDEGKNYVKKVNRVAQETKRYHVEVDEDRNVLVKGVLPGSYVFQATAFHNDGTGNQTKEAGKVSTTLKLTSDKKSANLGTLILQLTETVEIGQMAPDFEVETVDGKKIKLSDFRGRYILLDFWATWCGPCIAETPNLKKAHEAFSGDRFEIIGLSLDSAKKEPLRYARKKKLSWVNGFIGQNSPVAKRYGVRGIPSMWLIDPEGKVIEKNLRGTGIIEAVRERVKE